MTGTDSTITDPAVKVDVVVPTESKVLEPEVSFETPIFNLQDIDGKVVEIPSILPWGKEKKVLKIVGQAFEKVMPQETEGRKPVLATADFIDYTADQKEFVDDELFMKKLQSLVGLYNNERSAIGRVDAKKLLQFFSQEAPELITDLISIITSKNKEVVDERFDGRSVMSFAIPYILHAMRKYAESFAGAGRGF